MKFRKLGQNAKPLIAALWLILPVPHITAGFDQESAAGLQAALQATNAYHPALAAKRAELAAAGFTVESFEAQRYPSLSLQGSQQDDGDRQALLSISQPLWAFGKIDTPIRRSEAEKAAEYTDFSRRQRTLAIDTALAYTRIKGFDQRLGIARLAVQELQTLYDQIGRRQQGKLATKADVMLASARLLQSQAQVNELFNERGIAENRLRNLTQIEVDTAPLVEKVHLALPPAGDVVPTALRQSLEILFQQHQVTIAQLRVQEEQSQIYPTLSLVAQRQWSHNSDAEDENRLLLTLEGSFDGMGLINRRLVHSAEAQVTAALQQLAAVRNNVRERIARLSQTRDLQSALAIALEQSVAALQETLYSYQRQYQAGRRSWLELLNMQREVTQQRLLAADASNLSLQATLQLAILTGNMDRLLGIQAHD